MPKLIRFLTLAAAALGLAAFAAPRAHAQVETFETLSAYSNSNAIQSLGNTNALVETFTNVLELQSITFRFTPAGTDSNTQNLTAYLVQWNQQNPNTNLGTASANFTAPTDPNAVPAAQQSTTPNPTDATQTGVNYAYTQSFSIPPVGTVGSAWQTDTFTNSTTYQGYDVTLTPNQYLDPTLMYAIVLVDTNPVATSGGLGLLDINNTDPFTYGYATQNTHGNTLSAVQTTTSSAFTNAGGTAASGGAGGDYGFSQIVIVPAGNVVPTPEPRTAAAILAAAFVAFLVGRRLLQKDAETPVAAIAA